MDSRLVTILVVAAIVVGLYYSAKIATSYFTGARSRSHVAHFRTELSRVSADLGTTASKAPVRYNYRRGEPIKDTVDQMALQSGIPLGYSGTGQTKSAIGYSGELAGALTNFCVNEGLSLYKTASGDYELVPK